MLPVQKANSRNKRGARHLRNKTHTAEWIPSTRGESCREEARVRATPSLAIACKYSRATKDTRILVRTKSNPRKKQPVLTKGRHRQNPQNTGGSTLHSGAGCETLRDSTQPSKVSASGNKRAKKYPRARRRGRGVNTCQISRCRLRRSERECTTTLSGGCDTRAYCLAMTMGEPSKGEGRILQRRMHDNSHVTCEYVPFGELHRCNKQETQTKGSSL